MEKIDRQLMAKGWVSIEDDTVVIDAETHEELDAIMKVGGDDNDDDNDKNDNDNNE